MVNIINILANLWQMAIITNIVMANSRLLILTLILANQTKFSNKLHTTMAYHITILNIKLSYIQMTIRTKNKLKKETNHRVIIRTSNII